MSTTKHPSSKDVMRVIKNFERRIDSKHPDRAVNMGNAHVRNEKQYPVCHAGHYLLASDNWVMRTFRKKNDTRGYDVGGHRLAEHLGFAHLGDVMIWADRNPYIWGNRDGGRMFGSGHAFGTRKPSLLTIINHWKGVYDRLVIMENEPTIIKAKELISYPDITSELAIMPTEEVSDVSYMEVE